MKKKFYQPKEKFVERIRELLRDEKDVEKFFEVAKSEAQEAILNVLNKETHPLSIKRISERINVNYDNTKMRLSRMFNKEQINKTKEGKYFIDGSSVTCYQSSQSVGTTGQSTVTPPMLPDVTNINSNR